MNPILATYNVNFNTATQNQNRKRIFTNNAWLTQFIGDHYTIYEANSLLSGINDILQNNDFIGGGFTTQSLQIAIINSVNTTIYIDFEEYEENNNILPVCILPTPDFKVIVEAWVDYLNN